MTNKITYNKDYARELNKFLSLYSRSNNKAIFNMPSCPIDTYWHEVIKDHESYSDYCKSNFSCYIEHIKNTGYGEHLWVNYYHEKYGKLDDTWFEDDAVKKHYDLTGKLIASWDCTPHLKKSRTDQKKQEKPIEDRDYRGKDCVSIQSYSHSSKLSI